jgi:hypothetical protein
VPSPASAEDAHTDKTIIGGTSVLGGPAPLANSVGVNGCAATACRRSDKGAFFAARYAADKRASTSAARGSQFVAMLLPEASTVLVAITDTGVMSVPVVTVPVPQPAASSG